MNSTKGKSNQVIPDFQSVFNTYHDRLLFFCMQIIPDKDKAQDVVQEAFVRYWSAKESVSTELMAVKNYLYSSVRNLALNYIRHEKVVSKYVGQQLKEEQWEQSVVEAIISAEMLSEIHAAIQSLPEKYKTLSWMAFVQGKKNHEIAEELELSINTLKKQKQKAIELLKLKLNPEIFALLALLHQL